jgi:hypothetical protein
MQMKRNEGEEPRPAFGEPDFRLSDDLGEARITRARAIKLAGAALAGSALSLVWAGEADAKNKKKRRRRRRRRRRKARVTPNPVPTPLPGVPAVINVTNPSDSRPLTIGGVRLLNGGGGLIGSNGLVGGPVTIAPGQTLPVTVTFAPSDPLVDARSLRLIGGGGKPIVVVDEDGDILGDIDLL